MTNTLIQKIAHFLKEFEPFKYLTDEELILVCSSISIVNIEKNKNLFNINDKLHDSFYVVANGVINLSIVVDAEENIISKCYVGDVFGLRPFFAKNNYMMTAKAREDSIVYAIPIKKFKPFVSQNPNVLDYLLESFASSKKNKVNIDSNPNSFSEILNTDSKYSEIQYFQTLIFNKTPLLTSATSKINEVAELMTTKLIDSALITHGNIPIGIVTDSDFRKKIGTGRYDVNLSIDKIMSSPVLTVAENISISEAQLLFLKHGVTHLCVTKDGTDKSSIVGIISERDLIVAQSNNPGVLIKEIKYSVDFNNLKTVRNKLTDLIQSSIHKNIPLPHIYNISAEITTAIIKRSIELAILDLGSPPVKFSWVSTGSQGRKEQLLLSDQDSFIIFEDVSDEKYRDVKNYFLKLAKRTDFILEKIGYSHCVNGYTASNMQWCKSLSEWIKQIEGWVKRPGEKSNELSSIFFDLELSYGDVDLFEAISNSVYNSIKNNILFFDYLGNEALHKNPPLSFFKKFNLEEEGNKKGTFDIKKRGILPLVDSARLFALRQNLKGINNTYLRFKQLAILDSEFSEIYLNCAEAFLILSKFKILEGLKYDSSGDYINIEELSKVDREKLKNALFPMKELEDLIKDKFQLTQFS